MRLLLLLLLLLLLPLLLGCSAPQTQTKKVSAKPESQLMGTDCHMHVRPAEGAQATNDAERVVSVLREAKLARGCLLSSGFHLPEGCTDYRCPAQRKTTESANDWTLQQAAVHPALLGFCGIPIGPDWAADEVDRCASGGARGLKLHPVSQGLSLANPDIAERLRLIATRAAHHGMPILIHVDQKPEEVHAFFGVAARTPETTFIAAHGMAATIHLLADAPANVHIEISGITLAPKEAGGFFVPAWRQFGIEKVLFGSDWPTMNLSPKAHMEWLESYPLTADERELIVRKNAERMFPVVE